MHDDKWISTRRYVCDSEPEFEEVEAYDKSQVDRLWDYSKRVVDTNHDGTVTRKEYDAWRKDFPTAHRFNRVDMNRDGKITREDFVVEKQKKSLV